MDDCEKMIKKIPEILIETEPLNYAEMYAKLMETIPKIRCTDLGGTRKRKKVRHGTRYR